MPGASGRDVELSDPGEHDGEQVVTGGQPQCQASAVTDQAGRDAEQFVSQPGGVRSSVLVDPGQRLEQGERFPAISA